MAFQSAPSNLLALGLVVGSALFILQLGAGKMAITVSTGAMVVAALSPVGNMLLTPLEQRFPEMVYPAPEGLEGIIVLGGSYDGVRHAYLSTIVLEDDTEPLAMVADLARRYPQAKVIVSGGSSFPHDLTEASVMKRYFASFGIAPERIVTEDRSLSVAQHARFTADLLHPSPSTHWLLLAYGHQMPRAVGAFRKAGFNVFAFPVHLRSNGWRLIWMPDSTAAENLRKLDIATHEWLALLYYKLEGYSDDWFAGPTDSPDKPAPNLSAERPPPRSIVQRPDDIVYLRR